MSECLFRFTTVLSVIQNMMLTGFTLFVYDTMVRIHFPLCQDLHLEGSESHSECAG